MIFLGCDEIHPLGELPFDAENQYIVHIENGCDRAAAFAGDVKDPDLGALGGFEGVVAVRADAFADFPKS